jgi:thiamine biosynthesis lipoprotein
VQAFSHRAMHTEFEILIQTPDARYAGEAAAAAFDTLDRLEHELSRFIETSDIARINQLQPGQRLPLSLDTFACLTQCQTLWQETSGAFDITIGAALKTTRTPTTSQSLTQRFETIQLHPETVSLSLAGDSVCLDLGGIGKGYAADAMIVLLHEWDLDTVLVHGGGSTVFAKGPGLKNGWPLRLAHPSHPHQTLHRVSIQNRALSSSGLQKGAHILDPRTLAPVGHHQAVWVQAPTATQADALSTAFMVLTQAEVQAYLATHLEINAWILPMGGEELLPLPAESPLSPTN